MGSKARLINNPKIGGTGPIFRCIFMQPHILCAFIVRFLPEFTSAKPYTSVLIGYSHDNYVRITISTFLKADFMAASEEKMKGVEKNSEAAVHRRLR